MYIYRADSYAIYFASGLVRTRHPLREHRAFTSRTNRRLKALNVCLEEMQWSFCRSREIHMFVSCMPATKRRALAPFVPASARSSFAWMTRPETPKIAGIQLGSTVVVVDVVVESIRRPAGRKYKWQPSGTALLQSASSLCVASCTFFSCRPLGGKRDRLNVCRFNQRICRTCSDETLRNSSVRS